MRKVQGRVLYEVTDFDQLSVRAGGGSTSDSLAPESAASSGRNDLLTLEPLMHWVRGFLACPHAHLGRSGKVCPFVPDALRRQTLYFAVESTASTVEAVGQAMVAYLPSFRELAQEAEARRAGDRLLVALLVHFPGLSTGATDYAVIDQVQAAQKVEFVKAGMMLGQFHPLCREPGIRNAEFLPLRAPLPLLAVRHMVASDIVFLDSRPDYLRAFQQHVDIATLPPELVSVYRRACSSMGSYGT